MDYSKLSTIEQVDLSWKVQHAISNQDIATLRKLLPTAEDLLAFRTVGPYFDPGSSVLHIAYKVKKGASAKGSQFSFLKSIFTQYDLNNHPEIRKELLLRRDAKGRLAADYLFLYDNNLLKGWDELTEVDSAIKKVWSNKRNEGILKTLNKNLSDTIKILTNTPLSVDKQQMYLFLKGEIKKLLPSSKENEAKKRLDKLEEEVAKKILLFLTQRGEKSLSSPTKRKWKKLFPELLEEDAAFFSTLTRRNIKRLPLTLTEEEIRKFLPTLKNEEIHSIGKEYGNGLLDAKFNPYDEGVSVTSGSYLSDDEGKPSAYMGGSIREVYPEIRLRNIGTLGREDDGRSISGLSLNGDKSLRRQIMEKIDFPDDFWHHFRAIDQFEKAYKKIRENEGDFASIRYFNEERGALIFEDCVDKNQKVDAKNESGGYNGYCHTGPDHPYIVMVSSGRRIGETLLHELFHAVDLRSGLTSERDFFSETDLVKYALMLSEMNNNCSETIRRKMDRVNDFYSARCFQSELLSQIMQTPERNETYKNDPLILRIFKIGQILSKAKANNLPAIENRIKNALNNLPNKDAFASLYEAYTKQKEKEESVFGLERKLKEQKGRIEKKLGIQNEEFEPERKKMETTLVGALDSLTEQIQRLEKNERAGKIILPKDLLHHQIDGKMPEEVLSELDGTVSIDLLSDILKGYKQNKDDGNLIKGAYIAKELWEKTFFLSAPDELSNILAESIKDKDGTIKKLELLFDGISEKRDELDVLATLKSGKHFDDLTNFEKLDAYATSIQDIWKKREKDEEDEYINSFNKKIKECLANELEIRGYGEYMERFIRKEKEEEWEEKDIEEDTVLAAMHILPFIKKGNYSDKAMKIILHEGILNKKWPEDIEETLTKIPEKERYIPNPPVTIRENLQDEVKNTKTQKPPSTISNTQAALVKQKKLADTK